MSELNESVEVTVSVLSGAALDWAVAKAEGWKMVRVPTDVDGNFGGEVLAPPDFSSDFKFPNRGRVGSAFFLRRWSSDWAQCGLLIEKHAIGFWGYDADNWQASSTPENFTFTGIGPTHLIAACRLIVAAKFGKVVSVPKELIS